MTSLKSELYNETDARKLGRRNGALYIAGSTLTSTPGILALGLVGPAMILPGVMLLASGPLMYGLYRANQRDKLFSRSCCCRA